LRSEADSLAWDGSLLLELSLLERRSLSLEESELLDKLSEGECESLDDSSTGVALFFGDALALEEPGLLTASCGAASGSRRALPSALKGTL
jgi:hypothetical protein